MKLLEKLAMLYAGSKINPYLSKSDAVEDAYCAGFMKARKMALDYVGGHVTPCERRDWAHCDANCEGYYQIEFMGEEEVE